MERCWAEVMRKAKLVGFLMIFALSLGAAVYGIATDIAVAAPPKRETPEMVLTKAVQPNGEIIFRLVPSDEAQEKLAKEVHSSGEIIRLVAADFEELKPMDFSFEGDEPAEEEEEEPTPQRERQQKRLLVKYAAEEEPEVAFFEQEKQPTVFVQATSTKTVERYAGSIDYDAILQGPVIYDFGPEGELALEWVVWHEARGEPFDGQVAVAASAINRWEGDCPWFPDKSSIVAILSQPWQFAYQYVSPESLAAHPSVHKAVQAAIRGADPTVCEAFPDGAMWYYNPAGSEQTFPEADYELVIGHHHFHNYGYKWKR